MRSKTRDPRGRARDQEGPGELWVLGQDHVVSWDSRYFGAVPARQVRAGAMPVLTFAPGPGQLEDAGDRP